MIIAICGKSGAGKTTLRELLLRHDKTLQKGMSYTTRPIRTGEKVGDDYFFIDEKTYHEDMDFIITRKAGDYLYGMTADILKDKNSLLIIDIGGMKQLKDHSDFKIIFIDPPNCVLETRLLNRGDDIESIQKRLEIDKEFTLESIKKLATSQKDILHIKDEPIETVLKKAMSFIKKENASILIDKKYEKERE